ncbi:MFS transporter [Raineyella sp. W15-4]|uniref:MFS transporter n=1 Tax=Raineyella sp. W15-4 TaxID=3081651 RepID=UPI002954D7CB|nr:MFS transporter [Raineyella sp. W15-4]WOQ15584.1 MFS transporter [Raineyella sp. W15-4]
MYAIYQQRDGFPTLVLTVIFAAYAVGVMLSLYLAGHLSDWFGRRRVILAALLLDLVSAILFVVWNDVAGLIVDRLICGLSVGVFTATATAHLSELGAAVRRAPVVSNIVAIFANLGGIALGALFGGVIASYTARPLVVPYVVFAVLFVIEGVLVALVPETVERREERLAYRPQQIAVPTASRGAYVAAGAAAFGASAVFGTFTGLAPTFLVGILGQHSHLLAGLAPFIVFMSAAVAQIFTARISLRTQILIAIIVAMLGCAILGCGAAVASLALFLVGGGLAGAGILYRSALGVVGDLADPARRGEALAGVFLFGYAGMMIPPLLAAGTLTAWPEVPVLVGLTILVAALVVVSGSRLLRRRTAAGRTRTPILRVAQ